MSETPPKQEVERRGDETILLIEGAISLSEDPNIQFHYLSDGTDELSVRVGDTDDNTFTKSWKIERGAPTG